MKEIITKSTPLAKALTLAEGCRRCGHCCKYGSGFLVDDDIKKIAEFLKLKEEELKTNCLEQVTLFNTTLYRPLRIRKGKAFGTCIFFNSEKGCIIHPVKPLQCRVSSCNEYGEELSVWFRLNYLVNPNDAESIRQWGVYLASGGKNIPGGELNQLVPNPEKLKKILCYEVL